MFPSFKCICVVVVVVMDECQPFHVPNNNEFNCNHCILSKKLLFSKIDSCSLFTINCNTLSSEYSVIIERKKRNIYIVSWLGSIGFTHVQSYSRIVICLHEKKRITKKGTNWFENGSNWWGEKFMTLKIQIKILENVLKSETRTKSVLFETEIM